jgi:hypothetical protein
MTGRGGKRDGAGAPAKSIAEKARPVTFKLHPKTIETIKTQADELGISQAQVITRAIAAIYGGPSEASPPFES